MAVEDFDNDLDVIWPADMSSCQGFLQWDLRSNLWIPDEASESSLHLATCFESTGPRAGDCKAALGPILGGGDNPNRTKHAPIKVLQRIVQERTGSTPAPSTVSKARSDATIKAKAERDVKSWALLFPTLKEFVRINPGSLVTVKTEIENRDIVRVIYSVTDGETFFLSPVTYQAYAGDMDTDDWYVACFRVSVWALTS